MSLSYPDHHHTQPALPHPPSTASSPFAWAPPPLTTNPQSSIVEQHQKAHIPHYLNHSPSSSSSTMANPMLPPQSASPFAYPPPPLHVYPQQTAYPSQGAPGPASQPTLYTFNDHFQSYHHQPSNILPDRQLVRLDGAEDHHSPDLSDEPQHAFQSSSATAYPNPPAYNQSVPAQRVEPIEWKAENGRSDLDASTGSVIKSAPTDRPFRCDQCAQSFNRNHDLKRHKQIHLTIKPFPCDKCQKAFSRKDALRRHWLVKGCRVNAPRQVASDPGDLNGADAEPPFMSRSGSLMTHASKHRRLPKDHKAKEKTSPESRVPRQTESLKRDGSSISSKSSLADSYGKKEDHLDEQSVSEGFSEHQIPYGHRIHPYRHSNMSPSPRHLHNTPLLRTSQPYARLPSPQPIPISSSSSYPSVSYLSVQPSSISMPRASSYTDLSFVSSSEYISRSSTSNLTGQIPYGQSNLYMPPYPLPYAGPSSHSQPADQGSSYNEHQAQQQSHSQSVDHSAAGYQPSSFSESPSVAQTERSGPWNSSSSSIGLTDQVDQNRRTQMVYQSAHERTSQGANTLGSTSAPNFLSRPSNRSDGRFSRSEDGRQEGYPEQSYQSSSSSLVPNNHHLQHQQQLSLGLESRQHPLHQYQQSQPSGQLHSQHIHLSSNTQSSVHVQHHQQQSEQAELTGSYPSHSFVRSVPTLQHPMPLNLNSSRP
ncbi:c2h2 finger domain [Phaffia rhodozyma]|uniref:C2h2 finger domain n=1 Tax=Phaffia rhodozyma TaxID=264483 RepID=A0A0F7SSV0_PHARH|nr:c2h2 finger domain [Phaffia rhodozyma]